MAKFKYHAFDENQKAIKNFIVEDDVEIAKDRLESQGLQIINISRTLSAEDFAFKKELKEEQLASFCGEIGVILDSGVTIIRGLEILIAQTQNKSYKNVLLMIHKDVKKGLNLSTAMADTGVFPDLLSDMVESGELSSHLTEILFSMEDFYSREAAIKSKVKSASIYPMILLGVSVLMVVFFNVFVFSELKSLFTDAASLPFITAVLINSLDYLNAHPFIIISVIVGVVISFKAMMQLNIVKYYSDKMILSMPAIGKVKLNIVTSRVASSMAIFIKSAVPLVKVLSVVELLVANKYISERVAIAKEEIKRGRNIADAFDDCGVFDPMLVQMIRVGEETGKLEEMLFRLANIYEKKTEIGIARLVALIEPVFTLVVGLLVGVIIVAMALPIFDMTSVL